MSFNADLLYRKYQGQSLDYDGLEQDRGQCVQWVEYVLTDTQYGYGLQPFFGNAVDWWYKYGGSLLAFDKITNGTIKTGDIVVFNSQVGSVYGHIDMALQDGTTSSFLGADSNWGGNLTVHEVQHSNPAWVIGSLRLKGEVMETFNEGDRENINIGLFSYDKGFFKTAVGTDWKTAIYAILQSSDFKNENTVNAGDVSNINSVLGGDASVAQGQIWKQAVYDYILKNAGGNYKPYTGQLYTKS